MIEQYYSFYLGAQNKGYYYLKQDSDSLFSQTQFYLDNGELYTNVFQVKLELDCVTAFKYRNEAWVDFGAFSKDCFPSSAYPLLLPKVSNEPLVYTLVFEDSGRQQTNTVLTKVNNVIEESHEGKTQRIFTLKDGVPVEIDWGGPVSYLCETAEEALKGSPLTHITELSY